MFNKIPEHIVGFITTVLLLGGVFYSATTSYKTSVIVEDLLKKTEKNEKKLKIIANQIIIFKSRNGSLTEKDLKLFSNEVNNMLLNELDITNVANRWYEKQNNQLGSLER